MGDSLTFTIYVPDRDKISTQKVTSDDHDGWFGLTVPRIEVSSCPLQELDFAGVYFLLCGDEDSIDSIYVGESGNVRERLKVHMYSYKNGKEKFYWHTAIVCGSEKLDTSKTRYLEWQWYEIFKKLGVYQIHTDVIYKNTLKTDVDKSSMNKFINFMKLVLPKLKSDLIFEVKKTIKIDDEKLLYCKSTKAEAVGYLSDHGLTVLKNSKISPDLAPSFLSKSKSYVQLRNKLVANGIVVDNCFVKDYEFSSPSAASSIILGRPSNGNIDWKSKDGVVLKDIIS